MSLCGFHFYSCFFHLQKLDNCIYFDKMDKLSSDVIDNILSNISPWHVLPYRLLNKKWNNVIVSNRIYWIRQMRLYRPEFEVEVRL